MDTQLQKEIEAVLFASGKFIEVTQIAELLNAAPSKVRTGCTELQKRLESADSALQVIDEDDAFKLHVRDKYLDIVSRVVADTEVSGPVMETLAIVAWRSPIIQSEVVELRGSNAYDHIKELMERGFLVREPEGRSYKLRITEKFFDYFDVEGRNDIKEVFKEVEEAHRKKEMELELQHKRVEAKLAESEEPSDEEEQQTLSDKKVDIEDLDAFLEKAQKARKEMADDLQEHLPKKDSEE